MKVDRAPQSTLLRDMFVSLLLNSSVWMEAKSLPAWKLKALFCWKINSCVWSLCYPVWVRGGKSLQVTFHTFTISRVFPLEFHWVNWLAIVQPVASPSFYQVILLFKGMKSKSQTMNQKLGPIAGENDSNIQRNAMIFRRSTSGFELSDSHEMGGNCILLKTLSYLPSICSVLHSVILFKA